MPRTLIYIYEKGDFRYTFANMKLDTFVEELEKRYGAVKRARGCFLYTQKGVRLTDLYQEGGRALLGWGGNSAFTVFKNVLNRGVTGSFDTIFAPRLKKAVEELLASERITAVFFEKEDALKTALKADPKNTVFWRPWSQDNTDWALADSVIIEPPLPWTPSLFIVALKPSKEAEKLIETSDCKRLPSPLAAAVIRSIYNMISALQERSEKDWYVYDSLIKNYWTRRGPYLYPKASEKDYDEFVLHCLDCKIVISPFYDIPSIVPFGADKGVFTQLKNSPFH